MGSIQYEIRLGVPAERAWAALRRVEAAHRLFAGVLIDAQLHGDVRTVTFANGQVVRERIVDVNDERRRLVYSAFDGTPMTHHNASMQILPEGEESSRFVWITDFLPNAFGETLAPLIRKGAEALQTNLKSDAFAARAAP